MNAPLYLDFCHEDEKLSLLEDVSDSARFSIVATRREGGFACCFKGGFCHVPQCHPVSYFFIDCMIVLNADSYAAIFSLFCR